MTAGMSGQPTAKDVADTVAAVAAALASRDAEIERLKAENEHRRSVMSRFPFCPDHRDKVRGKECRECEIERLKVELGNLFAATAPLLALVEQLAGALELMKISKHEHHAAFYARERALAAAAAYRKGKA